METEEIVLQIQSGRDDLFPKLWSRVKRFVGKLAYSRMAVSAAYRNTRGCEVDDLIQSGYIALVEAVKTYRPVGAKFLSWYEYYLRRAFNDCQGLRKRSDLLDRCVISLEAERYADNDSETWIDSIPDDEDHIADAEDRLYQAQLREAIDKALNEIPARQALVVRRTDLEDRTLAEAGAEIGVSFQRAGVLRRDALRALHNNQGLRAFLADNLNYYFHVGPNQFNTTHTSSTEALALRRIDLEKIYHRLIEGQA